MLALRVLGIGFLNKYLNLEFLIGNEVSSFISLYRSQVKPKRNSKYFYEILKPTLNMFQIKYPIWLLLQLILMLDIENTSDSKINCIATSYGLYQIINELIFYQTGVLLALAGCLPILTWYENQVSIHYSTQTVTIKLFLQNSKIYSPPTISKCYYDNTKSKL